MKVGMLGGSFDPPHFGHIFISLQAIKRLNLQSVWWLVTPQNPLKNPASHTMDDRCKLAMQHVARFKKIKILSAKHRSTYDEVQYLKNKYPTYHFTWIMGIDNVINFHKWHKWTQINDLIPFLIFNRDQLLCKSMRSRFMLRFYYNMSSLPLHKRLSIVHGRKCHLSSTMIRNAKLHL